MFGPIPRSLFDGNATKGPSNARCNLRQLDQHLRWGVLKGHARGSWGYTLLRTAYTPEADELFPIAIARLKSYVHYWCHSDRFFSYGARCEERRVDFAEPNEEVFRRFHLDVVEDREGLAHLDGNGDGSVDDRFTALRAYFLRWRASVDTGANFNPHDTNNPRFCLCLVLDSKSIASLAQLPEVLPPLRCAVDIQETREFLSAGHGGWVWILETDYMYRRAWHEDSYHGWMRIEVYDLKPAWFDRLARGKAPCFWHEERTPGSGIYYFTSASPAWTAPEARPNIRDPRELDPKLPAYSTGDPTSLAYQTARERWPIILTQAIDDVHNTVAACDDSEQRLEGEKIAAELVELKDEIHHDRALTPIRDDGYPDAASYNTELEHLGDVTWLNAPWLFTECYLFRHDIPTPLLLARAAQELSLTQVLHASRISTIFSLSTYWKSYDVFAKQKIKTFRCTRPAVLELAARYRDVVTQLRTQPARDPEADKLIFIEMCKISLWGNNAEPSHLATSADIQTSRSEAEKHILVDDIAAAYARLQHTRDFPRLPNDETRVDIVLNKAGFELYTDLILAGYLLSAGLATTVVLHPKSIPWFVWDALPSDFDALLAALSAPRRFYETPTKEDKGQGLKGARLTDEEVGDLEFVFGEWSRFRAEGRLVLRPDRMWTGPGCFWRLCVEAGPVVEHFCDGHLAIFKGDLNYRKLVGDVTWDPTMPFEDAIGVLGPGQGINLLSLRTCQSDVVVGLKPGEDERLKGMEGGGGDSGARKWAWSGKWALACFSES